MLCADARPTAEKTVRSAVWSELRGLLASAKLGDVVYAIEQVGNYSSSEPRDIYAFYLQRGLAERARAYRKKALQAAGYDLDYYFKMVDEHPEQYTRQ